MMDQLHVEQQCDQGEDASYAADRQRLPWNDFDHKAARLKGGMCSKAGGGGGGGGTGVKMCLHGGPKILKVGILVYGIIFTNL